jgi:hypothetical protein
VQVGLHPPVRGEYGWQDANTGSFPVLCSSSQASTPVIIFKPESQLRANPRCTLLLLGCDGDRTQASRTDASRVKEVAQGEHVCAQWLKRDSWHGCWQLLALVATACCQHIYEVRSTDTLHASRVTGLPGSTWTVVAKRMQVCLLAIVHSHHRQPAASIWLFSTVHQQTVSQACQGLLPSPWHHATTHQK